MSLILVMTEGNENWKPVIRQPSGGRKCDASIWVDPTKGVVLTKPELGYEKKCVKKQAVDPKTGEVKYGPCIIKSCSVKDPAKTTSIEERKAA